MAATAIFVGIDIAKADFVVACRPDGTSWTASKVAAGVLEAVKGFRRLKGHADMPTLGAALRARDRRLGWTVSAENVA
jgi:hypothetical protein